MIEQPPARTHGWKPKDWGSYSRTRSFCRMTLARLVAVAVAPTLLLASGSVLILIPFLYMISTSLKDPAQIRSDSASLFQCPNDY